MRKKRKFFYLFVSPGFLGILVFVLLPFGDVVRRSFTGAVTGKFTGVKNYGIIFTNQAFLLAVKNTMGFTLVCIPLLVLTGFVTALLLNGLGSRGWMKAVYLFPLAMPTATIVMVWKMVFYRQGFLNLFLTGLGTWTGIWGEVRRDYLGTPAAFWVLVGSYVWKNLGYTVILWLAGIKAIPAALLEAARVDGAGKWQRMWYIILPNLKGSLYTIVILSFLNSFKIYREAYLTAGAYPDKSIYLLQHLFNNWFVNLELDKMAAAAVCTGGFLMIVILILQRLWDGNEWDEKNNRKKQ
ncbi:MAG: sugar ABC transporter permease [Lachnospiraceae bacterium]|nr:sugar ABC transporter permease [Lachnospiraceae bacterium]MDE7331877.1 sugar ABC transporter permease [Lachnospiraceae bacterium]